MQLTTLWTNGIEVRLLLVEFDYFKLLALDCGLKNTINPSISIIEFWTREDDFLYDYSFYIQSS